jgi:hypothetical protein
MKSLTIGSFYGVATKGIGVASKPGTLRIADGANVAPVGSLSFGPKWGQTWGLSASYQATIDTALAGATTNKVHFITLAANGHTFLVAWEYQNSSASRARGIWHVVGTGDPDFDTTHTITVTATNDTIHRDKTVSLNWYGSWIGGELFLGNGTDANLVWNASAALALLATGIASTLSDTSQFAMPPVKSFIRSADGRTYGAGNVTYPLRVWEMEPPNLNFPTPHGILSEGFSYTDLQTVTSTAITALGAVGESIIAHVNLGGPMILLRRDAADGWKFDTRPMIANASAINPASARDTKIAPFYLGRDLEIYSPKQRIGYDRSAWRDSDIVTNQSSGAWNAAMTKPLSGDDYLTSYDDKNGRLWLWALMSAGSRQGVYCFDERTQAIMGPWRYPDFVAAAQLRDENLNGCMVLGFTRDGTLLWADLADIGEQTDVLPAYGTALAAAYTATTSAPTADAGIPYIGVDTVNGKFTQVLNGQTLYRVDPWSDWAASGSVTPDAYFNNARLAVIEFAELDVGESDLQKEFCVLRSFWQRNPYAYLGIAVEVNGYRYWMWAGTSYPFENWLSGIAGEGASVKLRIHVVSFNDASTPAVLQRLTVDWLPGGLD